MTYWDQLLTYLQKHVSAQNYENWLKGTSFIGIDGDTMFVSVPDRETRAWLETEYAGLIRSGIRDLGLPLRHVSFESSSPTGTTNQALANVEAPVDGEARSALNPKFTFRSFVV